MIENEMAAAAVAGCLAHAARQRGGTLMATAAELHALGNGPLWPRSALELDRRTLPALARRAGLALCTVRPMAGAARGVWHIQATPLPAPAPVAVAVRPVATPAPLPALPAPAPLAPVVRAIATAMTAAHVGPTPAEFERVKAAAEAETARQTAANWAKIAVQRRANEHAKRVEFLANTPRTRTVS